MRSRLVVSSDTVSNDTKLSSNASSNRDIPYYKKVFAFLGRNESLIGLIAICVALSFSTRYFLTFSNIVNILEEISVIGVIAVGMTFVIICGEIDLTVGSVIGLSGTTMGILCAEYHWSIWPAMMAAVCVGILVGGLTGAISIRLSIPSFIVTLALMSVVRGLAFIVSNGYPASIDSTVLTVIGQNRTLGIPNTVIVLVVVVLVGYYLLEKARLGRYVLAVGGNKEAARLSGIPVTKIRLLVFLCSGLLAGISGILLAGEFKSGDPNAGTGFELDAVAAVVLGGTDLYGGRGTMIGTVLGMLIIGVINNGMNLLNISPYYQLVVKGLVIVLALGINRIKRAS